MSVDFLKLKFRYTILHNRLLPICRIKSSFIVRKWFVCPCMVPPESRSQFALRQGPRAQTFDTRKRRSDAPQRRKLSSPSTIMIRPLITRLAAKPFQRPIQSLFKASIPRPKPFTSSPFLFSPLVRPFSAKNVATASEAVARHTTNWPKILGQLGILGGTAVGLNLFFNREQREGGIPRKEREYLNQTFKYTGASLGITALSAFALFRAGFAFRIMSMNPWAALGLGLVTTVGILPLAEMNSSG
jgi:hypothetical protein